MSQIHQQSLKNKLKEVNIWNEIFTLKNDLRLTDGASGAFGGNGAVVEVCCVTRRKEPAQEVP